MELNNKWTNDETDSEYEEEYVQNEVAPPPINEDFVKNILKVKHSLYDNIVLAPTLGTKEAQSPKVLEEYLNKINDVYILSIRAQNGEINEKKLERFPMASKDAIRQTLRWIRDYFSKNQIPDTIPYSDFIRKSFHEYQFIQDNSFE